MEKIKIVKEKIQRGYQTFNGYSIIKIEGDKLIRQICDYGEHVGISNENKDKEIFVEPLASKNIKRDLENLLGNQEAIEIEFENFIKRINPETLSYLKK